MTIILVPYSATEIKFEFEKYYFWENLGRLICNKSFGNFHMGKR